jgi:F0F1-type ATP synthase epsilon subunit
MKSMMHDEEIIRVRISKATEIIWEGKAYSLSAKNSEGTFDVLPMHANFITFLQNEPITIHTIEGEKKTFSFSSSVLNVHDNFVSVYTGIDD